MERNIQTNGTVNVVALLISALAGFAVAFYAGSWAGQIAAGFLAIGCFVAGISRFHMRLEQKEQLEKLEVDELSRKSAGSALFKNSEVELFPARQAREQFERYAVPGFAIFLLVLQSLGAFGFWRAVQKVEAAGMRDPQICMALLGLVALILFILGKYSTGIARLDKQRLLNPSSGYLLLGAYLYASSAAAIGANIAGYPRIDLYLAKIMALLLGFVAVENLFSLVFEMYRPRIKGEETRLLYESRFVGLAGQPEGIFATAAHALDYQFGFKVSETWFYQFLRKYIGLFLLAQAAVLLISTSFIFIEAGEQGMLERFGRPVKGRTILKPGAHLVFPWPVDRVYRYRTEQIQSFTIGYTRTEEEEEHGGHGEEAELWSVPHYKEEHNMLVASREETGTLTNKDAELAVPVNLLAVNVPVHYQVTNLLAWATRYSDGAAALEKAAVREATRYLVNVDVNEILTSGRQKASEELFRRIQACADELELGVKIIFVGMQNIHPPVKVAPAYQAVIAAMQEKESRILEAQAYAAKNLPMAQAEATKRLREAESYLARTAAGTAAQAGQFTNQLKAWQASPRVFEARMGLQAFTRGAATARKYVLAATNTTDVFQLNLEEKASFGIEDIPEPQLKTK